MQTKYLLLTYPEYIKYTNGPRWNECYMIDNDKCMVPENLIYPPKWESSDLES